jgi:hypothetical protein
MPTVVVTSRQLRDLTTEGMAALVRANEPPFIFVRSGELCHVVRDEAGRPSVEPASDAWLRGSLSRSANWMRMDQHGHLRGAFPPPEVVRDIASIDFPPFPALSSVTEVPTLRADGTILGTPGYDPVSTVFYAPANNLKMFPLPDFPTQKQVIDAKSLIEEAIGEFPYADDASRANVFGLLLTPVLRPAIFGCTPLAVVDAPQAGTGKSLLIDVLSIITTGRPSAMVPYPSREEEMQKQIGASLIAGRQLIAFDNLEGELRSPALALALTAKEYEARILGFSKNMTVPNMATWIVTGNNIRPAGDMPRRCYQIRLDAKQSKPYTGRSFRHPDLLRWVAANRSELLHALLIIARYWFATGCPDAVGATVVGSFEDWHRKIGGIVTRAHIPEFLGNYARFIEREDESPAQWENFLAELYDRLQNTKTEDKTRAFTIRDLYQMLTVHDSSLAEHAPAEISDCISKKGGSPQITIGKLFRFRRNRRFGYGEYQYWIVRSDDEPPPETAPETEPAILTNPDEPEPDSKHKGAAQWHVKRFRTAPVVHN